LKARNYEKKANQTAAFFDVLAVAGCVLRVNLQPGTRNSQHQYCKLRL